MMNDGIIVYSTALTTPVGINFHEINSYGYVWKQLTLRNANGQTVFLSSVSVYMLSMRIINTESINKKEENKFLYF